ncbi:MULTISPECIES: hypothetical protein [unclassified Moorena]|nr:MULTISPECIES: hypothetical protein [unclassified Moorena]NEO09918.1 hypothetical protein [Moorena sp. SIO3I8]NEO20610.1 hypothetical protein [Moorena sp. SIO4A5]NEP22966.1 hypothetical protein [Moorena sp. SIO3I6]NEQ58583.1 hypothetical protein [Moorena sp. SIO4A1]
MGRWGDGEMGRWGDGEMGRFLLRVIIRLPTPVPLLGGVRGGFRLPTV